ncbi:hypothetical protein GCM10028811_37690 [Uliginosibacterium sediminicola]
MWLRIALCAAFINALVPTLSYLFAVSAGKQVIELCTSFGLKKIVVDVGREDSVPAETSGHQMRCQFCLASQDAATLIAAPVQELSPARQRLPLRVQLTSPGQSKPWPPSIPRAPPLRLA